jgi:hypothetical protein
VTDGPAALTASFTAIASEIILETGRSGSPCREDGAEAKKKFGRLSVPRCGGIRVLKFWDDWQDVGVR